MLHTGLVSEWLLVTQVVGYTVSTVIVLLLVALVRRAARFDDSGAYALLAWSVLLWNVGNLVASVAVLLGLSFDGALVTAALAAAFSGAALSSAGALIMWHRLERPSTTSRLLVHASVVTGGILILLLWSQVLFNVPPAPDTRVRMLIGYHVSAFFVLGAWVFSFGRTTLASRVGIGMAGLGALGVGVTVFLEKGVTAEEPHAWVTLLEVIRQIATYVMTLGALFFLARFRLADVFIRQSLRMSAAALLGVICASAFVGLSRDAFGLVVGTLAIAALLLSFAAVDRLIIAIVDRWLFRQPDYERALTRWRDELAGARDRSALQEHAAKFVRETMALQHARVTPTALAAKDANVVVVPCRRAPARRMRWKPHLDGTTRRSSIEKWSSSAPRPPF